MIELSAIDRFAGLVSDSQRRFILALDGIFYRLKSKNASTVAEFKNEALSILGSHLADMRRLATDSLPVIAFLAGEDDQHAAPKEYLLDAMRMQSLQSISLFANALRRIHFDRVHGQSAVSRGLVVKQIDRIGRKGSPERFAYLSARKVALDTFNDTKFVTNLDNGVESRVRYDDPNHKFHGMLITQYPQDGTMTYQEAREKIFHPQSQAVLD